MMVSQHLVVVEEEEEQRLLKLLKDPLLLQVDRRFVVLVLHL